MPRSLPAAATGLAAVLVLAACGVSSTAATDRAVTPTSGSVTADVLAGGYAEMDIQFMEQMILHRAQAQQMAELAADRGEDAQVRIFAEQTGAAQEPVIAAMEAWLQHRDLPVPSTEDRTDHAAHAEMPGMLTPLQMDSLASTSGAEFDERFLRFMIAHHQGSLAMAAPVVEGGVDPVARKLAGDVHVEQQAEIDTMNEMLARLP